MVTRKRGCYLISFEKLDSMKVSNSICLLPLVMAALAILSDGQAPDSEVDFSVPPSDAGNSLTSEMRRGRDNGVPPNTNLGGMIGDSQQAFGPSATDPRNPRDVPQHHGPASMQQTHIEHQPQQNLLKFDSDDREYELNRNKAMSFGDRKQRLIFGIDALQQIGNGGQFPQFVKVSIQWRFNLPTRSECTNTLMLRIRMGYDLPSSVSLQFPVNGEMALGFPLPADRSSYGLTIPTEPIIEAYRKDQNANHPFWLTVVSAKCKKVYGISEPFYLKNYEWREQDLMRRSDNKFEIDRYAYGSGRSKLFFDTRNLELLLEEREVTQVNVGIRWNLLTERNAMLRCSTTLELVVKQGRNWKDSATVQWTHLPKLYSKYTVPLPLGPLKHALQSNLPNNFFLGIVCARDKQVLAISHGFKFQQNQWNGAAGSSKDLQEMKQSGRMARTFRINVDNLKLINPGANIPDYAFNFVYFYNWNFLPVREACAETLEMLVLHGQRVIGSIHMPWLGSKRRNPTDLRVDADLKFPIRTSLFRDASKAATDLVQWNAPFQIKIISRKCEKIYGESERFHLQTSIN